MPEQKTLYTFTQDSLLFKGVQVTTSLDNILYMDNLIGAKASSHVLALTDGSRSHITSDFYAMNGVIFETKPTDLQQMRWAPLVEYGDKDWCPSFPLDRPVPLDCWRYAEWGDDTIRTLTLNLANVAYIEPDAERVTFVAAKRRSKTFTSLNEFNDIKTLGLSVYETPSHRKVLVSSAHIVAIRPDSVFARVTRAIGERFGAIASPCAELAFSNGETLRVTEFSLRAQPFYADWKQGGDLRKLMDQSAKKERQDFLQERRERPWFRPMPAWANEYK